MEPAIAYYNQLVTGEPAAARAEYDQLCAGMDAYNVRFAGRPMETLLRPCLLSEAQDRILRQATESVMALVSKAARALFAGQPSWVYDFLGFPEAERRLLAIDPGYPTDVVFTRLDGFLDGHELKFVEFNHDSPGGIGYSDQMVELFLRLPLMARLRARFPLRSAALQPVLLDALRRVYESFGRSFGLPARPSIAIVDWAEVKTRPDFEIIQAFFRAHDLSCIIADPRELELRNGRLYCRDFPIDLVYRRVLLPELLQKADEVSALLKAYETRAACFINSFRCRLTENKSFFHFLTDPVYATIFSADDLACLRRYIPWTRRVAQGFTDFHGERIDLGDYVMRHRERFVLKPNNAYGGQGVCLGDETDAAKWEAAWRTALDGHWVVQERVAIPTELYPVPEGGAVTLRAMKVNIGPYYIDGRYAGSVARISASSIINVSAGGGSVPAFVVGAERSTD